MGPRSVRAKEEEAVTPRYEQRHLLPRKTPWLYFGRDHPLQRDTLRQRPCHRESDFGDQEEEWGWLMELDED